MRRRSSHLSTGCLLLTRGLTGPLGFATVLYSLVDPAGALGVMVSANVYLAIPVLIAWGMCQVVRAARTPQQSTLYSPQPAYPPLSIVPPPQAIPRRHATGVHPRSPRTPRTPRVPGGTTKPAHTLVYWGRAVVGWEDEQGNVHFDRKPA
jgi:hypothetical protein